MEKREMIEKLKDVSWWREKCLTDLYFLCRVVLQTLEDPTPGFKDLYKPTHKKMTEFIEKHMAPEQRFLLLCPRGWIKSYLISVGFVIQKFLQNLVNDKGDAILLTNATLNNAQMFLKKIKYNFEFNELLRALFPEIPRNLNKDAPRWTLNEITLGRTSLEVGSVEGNLVSKHYSILINDDLVNKENSSTLDQVEKVIDWWKLARSLLEHNGVEIMIGTRWHSNDLYGYILREFMGLGDDELIKARKDPIFEKHQGLYHVLRISCWQDPLEEKGSTFPNLFPEEKLHQIKKEQAEFFDGQYLNDPYAGDSTFVKPAWIQHWKRGELPPSRLTYMLVDPAGKETSDSDSSGIVIVDAGSDRKYYVIYATRLRVSDIKVVEKIVELASYYQPIMVGVEENRIDVYRDLVNFVVPQMINQGRVAKDSLTYLGTLSNLFFPLKHRNRPKELRVKNLQGWIESGNMLFAPMGMDALKDEILRFGKARFDDMVDALAYVLDIGAFPKEGQEKIYESFKHPTTAEREKAYWEAKTQGFSFSENLLGEVD